MKREPYPYERNVSSPRGAPMGRPSDPVESFDGLKVHLHRMPWVDGDYDPGGAYWGGGEDSESMWCGWVEVEGPPEEPGWNGADAYPRTIHIYFRARNRAEAKRNIPGARFYR